MARVANSRHGGVLGNDEFKFVFVTFNPIVYVYTYLIGSAAFLDEFPA